MRRRTVALMVSGAVALGLGVGVGISGALNTPPTSGEALVRPNDGTRVAQLTLVGVGGAPIPGGEKTSVSEAEASAGFPILRPNDRLASDANLVDIWMSSEGAPQVALQYDSGVLVYVQQAQFDDPVAKYRAIVSDFGTGEVTSIGSAPALILVGNIPGRAASIDMVIGEVNVQIVGGTGPFTVDDIIRLAESIPQPADR